MSNRYPLGKSKVTGALLLAAALSLFCVGARAETITIDVEIDLGESLTGNVGCGFGLVKDEANTFIIKLIYTKGTIEDSEVVSPDLGYNWTKNSKKQWTVTGLVPNKKFWCIIKATVKTAGGGKAVGATTKPLWMSVSDVDLDADTDNDGVAEHRPPSQDDAEDLMEYPTGPTADMIGLLVPLNDDNDVSWDTRDSTKSCDRDTDDEILDLELRIIAKKAGETTYDNVGLWWYDDADPPVERGDPGFNHTVPAGDYEKSLHIETWSWTPGGSVNHMEVYFDPDDPEDEDGHHPVDKVRYLLVGTDIDVDSDNHKLFDDTIEPHNHQSWGEDFYENHLASELTGVWTLFTNGMLVPINDGSDDNDADPDNGWNGTDWTGPESQIVVTGEDDLKPLILRAMKLDELSTLQKEAMEALNPRISLKQIGGDGALRIFTTGANPQVVWDNTSSGSQHMLSDNTSFWTALKGDADLNLQVEGLTLGEVILEVTLRLRDTVGPVIHADTVRITVIDASLMLYKRDKTTKVIRKSDPGARLAYNNDDDDADGGGTQMDCADTDGVAGEDDVIKAVFDFGTFFDGLELGKVIIERANTKIKLWKQETKGSGQEITFTDNKKEYDLFFTAHREAFAADIKDKTLWVEGFEASTDLKDTELKLTYEAAGGASVIDDPTKITVLDSALKVYPGDGTSVLALDKEADPGAYVLYNNDDDDSDETADWNDTNGVAGEDDMCKVQFAFNSLFNTLSVGKVVIERSSNSIRLWKAQAKGAEQEIVFTGDRKVYDLSIQAERTAFGTNIRNKYLYVEGCTTSSGLKDTELKLVYEDGDATSKEVCVDPVKVTVVRIDLKDVWFTGTKNHTIRNDEDDLDYGKSHWLDFNLDGDADDPDEGDRKFPVAFTRDTYMKISANIEVAPAAAFEGTIKIKAKHAAVGGNYDFQGTPDFPSDLEIRDVQCDNKLANEIDYMNPMELVWHLSFDGGTTWYDFAKSKNVVYVTLGDPTASPLYETPIKIGCEGADGLSSDIVLNFVDEMWPEFTDRNVVRVDGMQMKYWDGDEPPQSIGEMLADAVGDGSCIAWSQLLHWCMKSQGLETSSHIYMIEADTTVNAGADGFYVKNWNFDRHIRSGTDDVRNSPVLGDDVPVAPTGVNTPCILPGPNGELDSTKEGNDTYQTGLYAGTTYRYVGGQDARDQAGVPGQGNANPPGGFESHWVCKISGVIYDPSYGIGDYLTEAAYENAAIDAIFHYVSGPTRCRKDSDGVQELEFTHDPYHE